MPHPDISIVMACYNAAEYMTEAVQSALDQEDVDVEVLIIDDHSSDTSLDIANALASRDTRVRVFQTPQNIGPGGARNVGIKNMRGRWYSMLDCDDKLDPARSRTLLDAAEAAGADMIADNLLVFGGENAAHTHLGRDFGTVPRTINLDDYFAATVMFSRAPNLGFLKPVIRRKVLEDWNIEYRTDLRIGEDDELVIHLLLAKAKYTYFPQALYHYRKHDASISHRLSSAHSALMVKSEQDIRAQIVNSGRETDAYRARYSSILDAAAFSQSVDALKSRNLFTAIAAIARRPSALRHFAMPIQARWKRTFEQL